MLKGDCDPFQVCSLWLSSRFPWTRARQWLVKIWSLNSHAEVRCGVVVTSWRQALTDCCQSLWFNGVSGWSTAPGQSRDQAAEIREIWACIFSSHSPTPAPLHASGTAGKGTRPNICFLYLGHWDVCGFGWERSLIYGLSLVKCFQLWWAFSPLYAWILHTNTLDH